MYDVKGIDLSTITNFDVFIQILNEPGLQEQKR
jgi:hypothetical protein